MAVDIPFFGVLARIDEVLETLGARHRSAVVADDGARRWLIYAGDLAAAHARGKVYVADLPATAMLPIDAPLRSAGTRPLALIYTSLGTARVRADDPSFAKSLTMTGAFRCTGPTTHFFPRPEVELGQNCPKCTTSQPTVPVIETY